MYEHINKETNKWLTVPEEQFPRYIYELYTCTYICKTHAHRQAHMQMYKQGKLYGPNPLVRVRLIPVHVCWYINPLKVKSEGPNRALVPDIGYL